MTTKIVALPSWGTILHNHRLFTKSTEQYSAWIFGLAERRISFISRITLAGYEIIINPGKKNV